MLQASTRLLAFSPYNSDQPRLFERHIKSPKNTRCIRKDFITSKEPPRTKRDAPSKRTNHLRIGRHSFRQDRPDKSLRIELFWGFAKVLWLMVLDVRRTDDVVADFQGEAADGGFLYHDAVRRGGGMQS